MTLDKCIVLRIGTLTRCPLCRESHTLCRSKNPAVISIWLLVGFNPATLSVQSTLADNTRKRVWQYIEKERKKPSVRLSVRLFATLLGCLVCEICNSKSFHSFFIQTLHNDCSHIEDVHLLLCAQFIFFLIFDGC